MSYREYLGQWIQAQGDRAYGLKGKIAQALKISSSLLSQIMKEEKSLTPDQASDLADFVGLNDLESDYLHLLVDFDRASSPRFREKLKRRLEGLRTQAKKIGKRVPRDQELSDEQKAIYYSSWHYVGARSLTTLPGCDNPEALAKRLNIEAPLMQKILRFLIENGLCREEGGRVLHNMKSIHLDKDSALINKHHQNWRLQSMQRMEARRETDVFYTGAMALSHHAAEEIRKQIPTFIQSIAKIAGPSDCETTACLGIDWFEY